MSENKQLLQGNIACIRGAIYAGMRFYSGYPITPSTELAEESALLLPKYGGAFIQMEDEIAGIAAAIGASAAGTKSMTATSGPGFSLKQENLGYAVMAEIPLVIVNVMRGGPSTGLPTFPSQSDVMQTKWGTHGDSVIITIAPWSVQECFDLTVRAFNLSEKYRNPVVVLSDEIVGHSREAVVIPEEGELEIYDRLGPVEGEEFKPYGCREGEIVGRMAEYGSGHRHNITGLFHDEYGFPTNSTENADRQIKRIHSKINDNRDDICTYEEYFTDDCELLIISYGSVARSALDAVHTFREKGLKVGLFRPVTLWPSPKDKIIQYSKKVKNMLVIEMNLAQYFLEIERLASRNTNVDFLGRANGEVIHPDEIVRYVMGEYYGK